MSAEIQILGWTGLFMLALTLVQGTRNVLALGLLTAAGNQHDIAPWTGINDRLNRAIRNLIEAIAIFAPVAIAVHLLGVGSETSALGAKLFLIARVVHAGVYIAGIPWIRTGAWALGVAGIVMTASPLLG